VPITAAVYGEDVPLSVAVSRRAWTARPLVTRRRLQVGLGCLWLIDAGLQFQPYMYQTGSNGFFGPVSQNTMGPPNLLTDVIRWAVELMVSHQVLFNTAIGVVQLAIGLGLLVRRTVRPALALSLIWALGVWWIGEAFGSMIFPQASMLIGAPGPALPYALLSVLLWPRRADDGPAVADGGLLGRSGAIATWAVVWCGTALLELEHANWAPQAISAIISGSDDGEPGPIAGMDHAVGHAAAGHGTALAFAILMVAFSTGWLALRPESRRWALVLGVVVSIAFWVVGQNFGTVLTGQATDPSLGPPMVLFALALWPRDPRPPEVAIPSSAGAETDSDQAALGVPPTRAGDEEHPVTHRSARTVRSN
jgi:hypothetical protein